MNRHARLREAIEAQLVELAAKTGCAHLDPEVARALEATPREAFVPEELALAAYDDRPLAIGHGQTISQPFVVALMTQVLAPRPHHRVLEIGTGSGYQAAVISHLVAQVHSVEVIAPLAEAAAERLARLGFGNVAVHLADGHGGWPEGAPYDRVLVTAATPEIPPALFAQLRVGGLLVVPQGAPWTGQRLRLYEKLGEEEYRFRDLLTVLFVPFTGHE